MASKAERLVDEKARLQNQCESLRSFYQTASGYASGTKVVLKTVTKMMGLKVKDGMRESDLPYWVQQEFYDFLRKAQQDREARMREIDKELEAMSSER